MGKKYDNKYHRWYAWYPVKTDDNIYVWRKVVWRRTFSWLHTVWKTHYRTDEDMAEELSVKEAAKRYAEIYNRYQ